MARMDVLWSRIIAYSGEVFRQERGKPFTYSVSGGTVYLDTTEQSPSRQHFTVALSRTPLNSPDDLRDLVGPRYTYAIVTDRRIAGGWPP